jgi:lipopolysaccharide/colanic/teichoic acid biosynthesis glycosyltransferase
VRGLVRFGVLLAPIAAVLVLGEIHAHLIGHYPFTGSGRFAWTVVYVLILEVTTYAVGIPDVPESVASAAWTSVGAVGGAAVVISIIQLAGGSTILPRVVVFGSALALVPILTVFCTLDRRANLQGNGADRVLAVIGPNETAALEYDLTLAPEQSVQLVSVLSPSAWSSPSSSLPTTEFLQAPPTAGMLAASADRSRANLIVLGRQAASDERLVLEAAELHGQGMRVRTLGHFYDEWLGKLLVSDLERISLMFDIQEIHARPYARIKRLVDLVVGLLGSVLLVVVVPMVAIADLVGNRGPIFFTQERIGKGGRRFVIYKFRTMVGETSGEWTDINDPRVPKVGRWLRRTHIDELPQSINLIRGTISLVGPRPEQPRYVDELREKIPFYDLRHLVKPGVTGWAQVKFLYGSSVEDALQKLQYEFFYMRHQGPLLDLRIMFRTLRSVLRLHGR